MKTKNTDMLDCTFSRRDMLRHIAVGLMAGLVSPTLLTGSALAAPAEAGKIT